MHKIYPCLIGLIFLGFAKAPQPLDPSKLYENTLSMSVNGLGGVGVMVAPAASSYKIEVKTKVDSDLLTLTTCHRDLSFKNVDEHFTYFFEPIAGIEDGGECALHIGAYNQKGLNSWGVIEFQTPDVTLPATLKCNGKDMESSGASICQSRQTLIQEVSFGVPVRISPDYHCPLPDSLDEKIFQFPIVKGECVYAFVEKAEPHRVHRMLTYGYESVILGDY